MSSEWTFGSQGGSCNRWFARAQDAVNAALRSWVANIDDTHYILGSALGPHPFPEIVRDFQSVIGREAKQQYRDLTGENLPDALVACVGGGSNAIGLFHPFCGR